MSDEKGKVGQLAVALETSDGQPEACSHMPDT